MKVHIKKFTSIILAVALLVSMMVVPVGAADDTWSSFKSYLVDTIAMVYGIPVKSEDLPDFTFTKVGPVTPDELDAQCSYYNSVYGTWLREYGLALGLVDLIFGGHAMPIADWDNGIQRPKDMKTGKWIVDKDGNYPYVASLGDFGALEPSPSDPYVNNWWLPDELSKSVSVMSYDSLAEICHSLDAGGHSCRLVKTLRFGVYYWVIQDYSTDGGSNRIYGNSSAVAYVADGEESAKNNYYDYIVGDDAVINDSQIIDLENGVLNLIDDNGIKLQLDIDSLTFDTGAKNYTVNAYTTVNEGDTYYYTYYTYNITYNITNTYVTYIGSNDAYDREEYEYYYQLPDGRSSADLTADEVAGMSFEFHDVVNYARSATDVSVRGLYHFDGNTNDSSYFSTQGEFRWKQGASITYMEAPSAFDGALYLDNTAHSFDIVLPSNMGSGDYTIQFRYYQASEPDTVSNIDNSIQIGGTYVLCWDEKTASRDPNGQYATWSLPVGTWNEIALVRNGGKLYVYLNGLCVSQESYSTVWNDTITFSLGSGSRAYSMIDELRVLNFALASGGVSYTPTAVPFDSNLVLVLPDSARPIADEYWSWDTTITPISAFDFTKGDIKVLSSTGYNSSQQRFVYSCSPDNVGCVAFYAGLSGDNFTSLVGHSTLSGGDGKTVKAELSTNSPSINLFGGIIFFLNDRGSRFTYSSGNYTITVVDSDLNRYSLVYNPDNLTYAGGATYAYSPSVSLGDAGWFRYARGQTSYGYTEYLEFNINDGKSIDIVYLEIVSGSSANTGHEKVTCIYPEIEMQPNTAAVQSEIPVRGYTVGGVRPTLPAKGDVWFPVAENRIQTCYIYTGSMWEEVGCRWYTGSRWIPIYAFDLTTLEDLFDIADAADAVVPITSESAFWRWWQLQWLDFREWLEDALSNIGSSGSGDTSASDDDIIVILPGESGSFDENGEEQDDGWSFLDLLKAVKDGAWKITKGIVITGVGGVVGVVNLVSDAGDFFDAYDGSGSDSVLGLVDYEGADIWD